MKLFIKVVRGFRRDCSKKNRFQEVLDDVCWLQPPLETNIRLVDVSSLFIPQSALNLTMLPPWPGAGDQGWIVWRSIDHPLDHGQGCEFLPALTQRHHVRQHHRSHGRHIPAVKRATCPVRPLAAASKPRRHSKSHQKAGDHTWPCRSIMVFGFLLAKTQHHHTSPDQKKMEPITCCKKNMSKKNP